jgi:transposase InsO family protein
LKGVGIHTATTATRFAALEQIHQRVRRHFGAVATGIAAELQIRHDPGSQYLSDDFQAELWFLRMSTSPAFVRAPEGNGGGERFIRTVEELRVALPAWLVTCNEQWVVERHGFRSPAQMRRELLAAQEAA